MFRVLAPGVIVLAALPGSARAETTLCTPISTLPAVITTQGAYCLANDLATAIESGTAITIAANNVTLDCNGRKLGGLAAGADTQAIGIGSNNRSNVTVRGCNVRGFQRGISLDADGSLPAPPRGQLVENNRLDGNTGNGILVAADGSVVRGNIVGATGESTEPLLVAGIAVRHGVDVVDNLVAGVNPSVDGTLAMGIYAIEGAGNTISRNRVRGVTGASGRAFFQSGTGRITYIDNAVSGIGPPILGAFICGINAVGILTGNAAIGFAGPISDGCTDAGGNLSVAGP